MYIALDIGGTNTRIASFKHFDYKSLEKLVKIPTNQDYKASIRNIIDNIKEIAGDSSIKGIGISMCAAVDKGAEKISIKPYHLPDWGFRDVIGDLKPHFPNIKIRMKNDAECGAVAEITYGADSKVNRLYFLIIGTGIGGAFVDRSVMPQYLLQTEVGYMIIDKNDFMFKESETAGSFYTLSAGKYIEQRYDVKLSELNATDALWDKIAADLAVGVSNIVSIFNPDDFVIAGGVVYNRPEVVEKMKSYLQERLKVYKVPVIRISEFGDNFSLYGALCLLFGLLSKPGED